MGYCGGVERSPTYGAHALQLSLKHADTDMSLTKMTGKGGAKRTHVFQITVTVTTESLFVKNLLDGKNAMLTVPLLHGS
jgi:hypothetical protein